MSRAAIPIILILTTISCSPGKKGLFGDSKTAHETYAEKLEKAGLQNTALSKRWMAASENSLNKPSRITLPHKETGYFAAGEPQAVGLITKASRGTILKASLQINPNVKHIAFMELYKVDTANNKKEYLAQADSTYTIQHEAEEEGLYLLRVQPELLTSIEYTLTITTEPSLAFPVSESGNPKVISVWNDRRDAGRNHEGVDIGATFRTPVIAAADGHVRSVTTNRLGGKVVFMRPEGKQYALYYAHLDSQIVHAGQDVKVGDTIGLIGNTGNAVNTPPHLHFGIYARGGAVDPLPFIDTRITPVSEISASTANISKWVRSNNKAKVQTLPRADADTVATLPQGSAVQVVAATAGWYRVQVSNGAVGYIDSKSITSEQLRMYKADTIERILDEPVIHAAAMAQVPEGTSLPVLGLSDHFYLVKYGNTVGWIQR
jgi:murein DD-endopeptidase MepM/ murein hydrolase activator NlpD